MFKVFLKNVSSIGIHPQLSHGGFQIDSVMLAPKSREAQLTKHSEPTTHQLSMKDGCYAIFFIKFIGFQFPS